MSNWDPALYQGKHAFVWQYGQESGRPAGRRGPASGFWTSGAAPGS